MQNSRERLRTEKCGEIACLKPANWQITNDDDEFNPFSDRLTSFAVVLSNRFGLNMQISVLTTFNTYDNGVVE